MAHPQYAQDVGKWLDTVAPWNFWCTFTFRYPPSLAAVRRAVTRYAADVEPTLFFWGSESGPCTGRNHVHGLIYFDELRQTLPLIGFVPISERGLWSLAFRRFGRSHVDAFDAELGATHYVSKYVSKQLSDWDLIGNFNGKPLNPNR